MYHVTGGRLQWLDGRAPLAGDHLHELEAAVGELDLRGVVVLGVDLAGPQRTAVLGLTDERTHTHTHTHTKSYKHPNTSISLHRSTRRGSYGTLYMLFVFFLGLASYISCNGGGRRGCA